MMNLFDHNGLLLRRPAEKPAQTAQTVAVSQTSAEGPGPGQERQPGGCFVELRQGAHSFGPVDLRTI